MGVWMCLSLGFLSGVGCRPLSTSTGDEKLEPFYVSGCGKASAGEFEEAILDFERAIQNNPGNAAAHLELGLVYYQQKKDYASAIYHFRKMLTLRPYHPRKDLIKDSIRQCETQFASSVRLGPVNLNLEKQIKALIEDNMGLTNEVKQLKSQLAQLQEVLASQRHSDDMPTADAVSPSRRINQNKIALSGTAVSNGGLAKAELTETHGRYRKHVIRKDENFYVISRKYQVKPEQIKSVNPGVDSRALQIGQVINVPQSPHR